MIEDKKIIRDSIHGDIKIEGLFVDLLNSPELQRLYNIKQLGLAHLVFPGAHHTRLEHSLGVYNMATKISELLNLKENERRIITCAALLHDIGHGPFSHTLESILRNILNVDHVDLTEKMILGEYDIIDTEEKRLIKSPSVHEIIEKYKINKQDIIDIIRGNVQKNHYLSQLLNSAIDVDQLDYLIRDAYYTGVAYGLIDVERFFQTLIIKNNQLAVIRKGVGVIENILMARALMYSSVYFHKTVRIAELMLSKAIELLSDLQPLEFFKMTDSEIINNLKNSDSFQHEIVTYIKYRTLFKQAYTSTINDLDQNKLDIIKKLENIDEKRNKEKEMEDILNIQKGHIIIDIPRLELHQAEPRINQTNIQIFNENETKKLEEYTPIASAIKSREIPDWTVMIVTDEKHRDIVAKKGEKILFS